MVTGLRPGLPGLKEIYLLLPAPLDAADTTAGAISVLVAVMIESPNCETQLAAMRCRHSRFLKKPTRAAFQALCSNTAPGLRDCLVSSIAGRQQQTAINGACFCCSGKMCKHLNWSPFGV